MSFDVGINFRQTAAYVTDGVGQTYCLADHYPTTRGGATFGWEDTAGLDFRDRSNTADPRLAGINFSTVAGTRFRIDLPAAGAVGIHAAGGDGYGGGNPCNYDFKDGTTLLGSMTVVPTGVEFDDATNTARLRTDWPTLEAPLSVTFSGTIFRVVSHDASTNCIAHLRVVQSGGGTTVSGSGYSAGPSSAASVGLLRTTAPASAVGRGSAASIGTLRLTGAGVSPGLSAVVGSHHLVTTGTGSASGRGFGTGVLPGGITITASGCAAGRGSAASLGGLTIVAPGGSIGRAGGAGVGRLAVAAGGAAVSISVAAGVVPGPQGPGTRAGVWVVPGLARTWIVPAGGRTWEVPSQ